MKKTKIKVEFNIIGEEFDQEYMNELLSVSPNSFKKKGEKVANTTMYRDNTTWTINTEIEESFDINNQLKTIVNELNGKKKELKEIKKTHKVDYMSSFFYIPR